MWIVGRLLLNSNDCPLMEQYCILLFTLDPPPLSILFPFIAGRNVVRGIINIHIITIFFFVFLLGRESRYQGKKWLLIKHGAHLKINKLESYQKKKERKKKHTLGEVHGVGSHANAKIKKGWRLGWLELSILYLLI